eukprot:snap_masked-scaffold_5-processed-gene-14.37-mRNA-1 protein AED:1.00 eAED:1.00 QI:0/0/0/0/1/1/2/0/852
MVKGLEKHLEIDTSKPCSPSTPPSEVPAFPNNFIQAEEEYLYIDIERVVPFPAEKCFEIFKDHKDYLITHLKMTEEIGKTALGNFSISPEWIKTESNNLSKYGPGSICKYAHFMDGIVYSMHDKVTMLDDSQVDKNGDKVYRYSFETETNLTTPKMPLQDHSVLYVFSNFQKRKDIRKMKKPVLQFGPLKMDLSSSMKNTFISSGEKHLSILSQVWSLRYSGKLPRQGEKVLFLGVNPSSVHLAWLMIERGMKVENIMFLQKGEIQETEEFVLPNYFAVRKFLSCMREKASNSNKFIFAKEEEDVFLKDNLRSEKYMKTIKAYCKVYADIFGNEKYSCVSIPKREFEKGIDTSFIKFLAKNQLQGLFSLAQLFFPGIGTEKAIYAMKKFSPSFLDGLLQTDISFRRYSDSTKKVEVKKHSSWKKEKLKSNWSKVCIKTLEILGLKVVYGASKVRIDRAKKEAIYTVNEKDHSLVYDFLVYADAPKSGKFQFKVSKPEEKLLEADTLTVIKQLQQLQGENKTIFLNIVQETSSLEMNFSYNYLFLDSLSFSLQNKYPGLTKEQDELTQLPWEAFSDDRKLHDSSMLQRIKVFMMNSICFLLFTLFYLFTFPFLSKSRSEYFFRLLKLFNEEDKEIRTTHDFVLETPFAISFKNYVYAEANKHKKDKLLSYGLEAFEDTIPQVKFSLQWSEFELREILRSYLSTVEFHSFTASFISFVQSINTILPAHMLLNRIKSWLLAAELRFIFGFGYRFEDSKGGGIYFRTCSLLEASIEEFGEVVGRKLFSSLGKVLLEEVYSTYGFKICVEVDDEGTGVSVRFMEEFRVAWGNNFPFYWNKKVDRLSLEPFVTQGWEK